MVEQQDQLEKALRLMSVQRHDFANHLQVLSGFLQLNKADRARNYLKRVVMEVACESLLNKSLPPEDYLWFRLKLEHFKEAGVEIAFENFPVAGDVEGAISLSLREVWPLIESDILGLDTAARRLALIIKSAPVSTYFTFVWPDCGQKFNLGGKKQYYIRRDGGNLELTINLRPRSDR